MTDKEKELQAEAIAYYRKRIADLEKENEEIKERLKEVVEYLGQYCNDYPDCVIKAKDFIKEIE